MFVELHILQNFAPSNLNRDDTNAPKSCEFGGCRRARISSQCIKRSIRRTFNKEELVPDENLSIRTKLLHSEIVKAFEMKGIPPEEGSPVVKAVLEELDIKMDDSGKTKYLLFLGCREIDAFVEWMVVNWDAIKVNLAKKKGKEKKRVLKDLCKNLDSILDGGRAVDLALFGRMIADLPKRNIDAACQVAHAISTNRMMNEFDWYTAMDDLQPEEDTGASMMGTVEFNSACFYRYANIDMNQLTDNLQGDSDLAMTAVKAFIRASVTSIPTGKQNSMAAQNPPSFVAIVVRERNLWSLSNAFIKPVLPSNGDLMSQSIRALQDYWDSITRIYGQEGIQVAAITLDEDDNRFPIARDLDDLIDKTMSSLG